MGDRSIALSRRRAGVLLDAGLADLADLDLGPDGLDPDEYLGPQLAGHCLVAAVLMHQPLDRLFQAVLAKARTALVEMLADLREPRALDLAVQVGVDACQHLAAGHLMWLATAHFASFPCASGADAASAEAADAVLTRPSSAA